MTVRPAPDDPYLDAHRTRRNVKTTDTVRVTLDNTIKPEQTEHPNHPHDLITTEEP